MKKINQRFTLSKYSGGFHYMMENSPNIPENAHYSFGESLQPICEMIEKIGEGHALGTTIVVTMTVEEK